MPETSCIINTFSIMDHVLHNCSATNQALSQPFRVCPDLDPWLRNIGSILLQDKFLPISEMFRNCIATVGVLFRNSSGARIVDVALLCASAPCSQTPSEFYVHPLQ
jgi:hypothetical protein